MNFKKHPKFLLSVSNPSKQGISNKNPPTIYFIYDSSRGKCRGFLSASLFNSTRICFAFAPRMYDSQTPDIIALFNKVQVNVHQQ